MKKVLTIFTPTYNRGYILPKLYESLCEQTNKSFEWLIVDDGSSDNTCELVNKWIEEGVVCIRYVVQDNQGKHIAHNTGVDNCNTELFFCVDSDDYLLDNAVQDILDSRRKIIDDNISGIVSIRVKQDGKPLRVEMPKYITHSNLSELYEKHKFKGDTALVFKTSVLKQYMFPKIEGEKFIGEEYIYAQIDEKYKLFISHDKYYVCEYLEDGYTANMNRLIANNPKGYMELKKVKVLCSKNIKVKYKAAALYLVGSWIAGERRISGIKNNNLILMCSVPLAVIIYFIRFRVYSK